MIIFLQCLFWWPSLKKDDREYVSACQACVQSKASSSMPAGFLWGHWTHMSLDFITALLPSAGNIIILTTVDHFSKQPILSPKVPSALEMAQLMTDDGLQLHRVRLWLSLCLTGEERVLLHSGSPDFTQRLMVRCRGQIRSCRPLFNTPGVPRWNSRSAWVEYAHNSLTSSATGLPLLIGYQ